MNAALDADVREATASAQPRRLAVVGVAVPQLNTGGARWVVSERGAERTIACLVELQRWVDARCVVDAGRRERERREAIAAANRYQDQLDEAGDYLRGQGGEL
jgi:hypothetical protein